jgi:hypothetical protein
MKPSIKLLLLMVACHFTALSVAQKPEPVYSITRQNQSFEWYEQQAKAWKQEIDRGNAQPMAWVYWFEANRTAHRFLDAPSWERKQGDYFIPDSAIVARAGKAIPGTFEWYYMAMRNQQSIDFISDKTIELMFKAQEKRPFDNLILPYLMNYYLIQNDPAHLHEVGKMWYERKEIPADMLTTAYNMLIALEPNAILLTYGDNDSYPLWVLQQAKGIRTDVRVLNLSFVRGIPAYRARIFKELGIPASGASGASIDSVRDFSDLFRILVSNVTQRPLYVSVFAAQDVYQGYQQHLYLVGLSLKYSPKPFNNLEVMRHAVEDQYLLDFLKQSLSPDESQSVVNRMNKAYINLFVRLKDYYANSLKDTEKAASMLKMAQTIATNTGDEQWLKLLNK